jgi:hypothetical protein
MISDLSEIAPGPVSLIPAHDIRDFYSLTKRNQACVRQWLTAIRIIRDCPHVTAGFATVARHFQGERGFSAARVRTQYYAWKHGGWRALINANLEPADRKQPTEFVEFFRYLCQKNQRCTSQAIVRLRALWRDGEAIPGYGTWRDHWMQEHPHSCIPQVCTFYPRGWNVRNLHRYAPTKFEIKATRIGRSAAAAHRRLVYTTRRNLWVGSHIQIDDMWHDLMVTCLRERKPGRPLELHTHDLYSARKIRWGFRVRTRQDDGTYAGLAESMTRMILAATLFLDGYSPRGTILVAEHGTAAIRDSVESALHEASSGLITIARSGMEGAAAHDGQYAGRPKGNFRFKASLESLNSLTHGRFAHLPGQTGQDVMHRPEELHGLLKNNDALLQAIARLDPARAALLQLPLLNTNQFFQVAHAIYSNIENRTEHDLEGWDEHMVAEYQHGGLWLNQSSMLALTPAEQQLSMALLQGGNIATRNRRLSPREVWDRGSSDLIRIHPETVCDILGPDLASERTISRQMIEFQDREIQQDPLRYSALVIDKHNRETLIRDGEKVLAFANPFDPSHLFLQDAQGRYIGTAPRVQSVCKSDIDAIHRACGEAAHIESLALAPVRARHMQDARDRAARARNNARVLSGDAITPEQIAVRDRIRDERGTLDDILPSLSDTEPTEPTYDTEEIDQLL